MGSGTLVLSRHVLSLTAVLQEEQRTDADLADLAESAQLHHQLRVLGAALQTAQLDPAQFGLNATVSLCTALIIVAGECLSCAWRELRSGLCRSRYLGWKELVCVHGNAQADPKLVCSSVHLPSVGMKARRPDAMAVMLHSSSAVGERVVCVDRVIQWWSSLRPSRGRSTRSGRTEHPDRSV